MRLLLTLLILIPAISFAQGRTGGRNPYTDRLIKANYDTLQARINTKAPSSKVYEDVEVPNFKSMQTWVSQHPSSTAMITVLSDSTYQNYQSLYSYRKGKLVLFFAFEYSEYIK